MREFKVFITGDSANPLAFVYDIGNSQKDLIPCVEEQQIEYKTDNVETD